jgi:prevent-host-death family protein
MAIVATGDLGGGVGLRELRANLSSYLGAVKNGRSYVLTEHGKPVARLVPIEGQSNYERLVAEGLIEASPVRPGRLGQPVKGAGGASDLVADQRR